MLLYDSLLHGIGCHLPLGRVNVRAPQHGSNGKRETRHDGQNKGMRVATHAQRRVRARMDVWRRTQRRQSSITEAHHSAREGPPGLAMVAATSTSRPCARQGWAVIDVER